MADDLDDDFYIQENITEEREESDDVGEVEDKQRLTSSGKKRPLEQSGTNGKSEGGGEPVKKKKKKKRKRITEELELNKPTNAKKEDFIEFMKKNFEGKLSTVEWDDVKLDAEDDLFPGNEEEKSALDFVTELLPKWKKSLKSLTAPGSPVVMVLTASAIRAVDLNRELNDFKTDKCKTVKLFGKHLKISEQEKLLSKNVYHMAVGTPLRVLKLVQSGALKLDKLEAVVLDWNKRDVKSKRMIDIPEVKQGLLDLLKNGLASAVHKNNKSKFALL